MAQHRVRWVRAHGSVGTYPANDFGLFDMAGNVWEWTTDWYADGNTADVDKPCCVRTILRAGDRRQLRPCPAAVPDPATGDQGRIVPVRRRVLPALPAVGAATQMVDTGMSHVGFRCVVRSQGGPS